MARRLKGVWGKLSATPRYSVPCPELSTKAVQYVRMPFIPSFPVRKGRHACRLEVVVGGIERKAQYATRQAEVPARQMSDASNKCFVPGVTSKGRRLQGGQEEPAHRRREALMVEWHARRVSKTPAGTSHACRRTGK